MVQLYGEGSNFTPKNVQPTSDLKPFILNGVLLDLNAHWELGKDS